MRALVLATSLSMLLAAPAAAQLCFNGEFGTSLGKDTVDTVYPIQPLGFAFPFAGVTYTHIHVNDHGFVQLSNNGVPTPLATGSSALYTPSVTNFTAGGPKIAPLYCDMALTGGGECFLKTTPQTCTVTWWNVQSYGIPSPRFSFQLVLLPDGTIRFVYGPGCTNNSTFGGSAANAIVGVTPAGGAAAPAARDLSLAGVCPTPATYEAFLTANSFDCANNTLRLAPAGVGYSHGLRGAPTNCATATRYGAGCDTLRLGAVGLPTLGNAAFQLRAETLPAVAPLALFAFGTVVQNPGVPLGLLLGMNNCSAYTNADIGIFGGSAAAPAPTGLTPVSLFPLVIPANVALVGTTLSTQALAPSLANPFGLAASNGLELRIGIDGPSNFVNPSLRMQWITPGTVTIGSTSGPANEQPAHSVTLVDGFWMGKHEVTQAQYQAVMGSNPSYFQGAAYANAAQRPVDSVSWNDAMAYCAALTASERAGGRVPAGYQYRLPTEAEWEYCCRAGTTTPWHTGAGLLTSQANFAGAVPDGMFGSSGQTAVVGSYAPNAWGLHDMHGNVQEWCLDRYGIFTSAPATDPYVLSGVYRVMRGGDFHVHTPAANCRSARRNATSETASIRTVGFRVVLGPILVP